MFLNSFVMTSNMPSHEDFKETALSVLTPKPPTSPQPSPNWRGRKRGLRVSFEIYLLLKNYKILRLKAPIWGFAGHHEKHIIK